MFTQLANALVDNGVAANLNVATQRIFDLTPHDLTILIERMWQNRSNDPIFSDIPREGTALNIGLMDNNLSTYDDILFANGELPLPRLTWHHLIYAYFIENTKIYEIFEQVVHKFAYGEDLGTSTAAGVHWLRNTEQVFYRDSGLPLIFSLSSNVRPDLRAVRWNAYYRMFGMEVNHRTATYEKPAAANQDFVSTFEGFLREVWVGIEYATNATGSNPTDNAAIANYARRLQEMLRARRQNGNLSREEFYAVATMSWLHLTILSDIAIVTDLQATATSPEQRLQKIAKRVGVAEHGKSDSFLRLADLMSVLLMAIEHGDYSQAGNAPLLYRQDPMRSAMQQIITQWSIATGHNMKQKKP